jgi:hypothetical protein
MGSLADSAIIDYRLPIVSNKFPIADSDCHLVLMTDCGKRTEVCRFLLVRYLDRQAVRQTDRQKQTQTDWRAGRQTDTQEGRHTER